MLKTVAPALKALIESLIDYAGLFPPAGLTLDDALINFQSYQSSEHAWILNWFVIPEGSLDSVSTDFDKKLSVLGAKQNDRAATLESKVIVSASIPVYCEVSTDNLGELDAIQKAGNYAKIRCGGVVPEAIPSPEVVASFIYACADRKLPFKATAGLHHPIRSNQALTYESQAPHAVMHGFINVLMASALAYHGDRDILPVLCEVDASNFSFGNSASYKDRTLSLSQVKEAREMFIHSIGSCSFKEPIDDLIGLGLL